MGDNEPRRCALSASLDAPRPFRLCRHVASTQCARVGCRAVLIVRLRHLYPRAVFQFRARLPDELSGRGLFRARRCLACPNAFMIRQVSLIKLPHAGAIRSLAAMSRRHEFELRLRDGRLTSDGIDSRRLRAAAHHYSMPSLSAGA